MTCKQKVKVFWKNATESERQQQNWTWPDEVERLCRRHVWKDGYCIYHHPETIKRKKQEAAEQQHQYRLRREFVWWVQQMRPDIWAEFLDQRSIATTGKRHAD